MHTLQWERNGIYANNFDALPTAKPESVAAGISRHAIIVYNTNSMPASSYNEYAYAHVFAAHRHECEVKSWQAVSAPSAPRAKSAEADEGRYQRNYQGSHISRRHLSLSPHLSFDIIIWLKHNMRTYFTSICSSASRNVRRHPIYAMCRRESA